MPPSKKNARSKKRRVLLSKKQTNIRARSLTRDTAIVGLAARDLAKFREGHTHWPWGESNVKEIQAIQKLLDDAHKELQMDTYGHVLKPAGIPVVPAVPVVKLSQPAVTRLTKTITSDESRTVSSVIARDSRNNSRYDSGASGDDNSKANKSTKSNKANKANKANQPSASVSVKSNSVKSNSVKSNSVKLNKNVSNKKTTKLTVSTNTTTVANNRTSSKSTVTPRGGPVIMASTSNTRTSPTQLPKYEDNSTFLGGIRTKLDPSRVQATEVRHGVKKNNRNVANHEW